MIQSPPTLSQDPLRVTLTSQQTYGPFLYALQQWSSFNGAEIGIALATGTPPPLLNPPGPAPSETVINVRSGSLFEVGCILMTYQGCRAMTNGIIGNLGGATPFQRIYLPMVLIGLAGWLSSYFLVDQVALYVRPRS